MSARQSFTTICKSRQISRTAKSRCPGLSIDAIADLLCDRSDSIVAFGVRFLNDDEATSNEQEYPEGEEPGPDDVDKVVQKEGLLVGFGITYAIYWHFLTKHTAGDFTEFLKKRRIPHARKFATELHRIFAAMAE